MNVDARPPTTVKVAALLLVLTFSLDFVLQVSGHEPLDVRSLQDRWWPWPHLLFLVLVLSVARSLIRLDAAGYWSVLIMGGLFVALFVTFCILAAVGVTRSWPMAQAGLADWCKFLVLATSYTLLVLKPSRHAPWETRWNMRSSR